MPTVLQLRRGTTAEHSTFTGAEGEVTVNTSKDTLVVHDGSTQGGFEVALADGTNLSLDDLVVTGDATFSNDSSVTAAGSDQSGATALTKTYSVVGTATSNQGVKLPTAAAGLQYTVKNDTAVNIKIYPNTSGTINGGSANAAIDCPAGSTTRLIGASSTDWDTLVDIVVYDSSGTRLN